ncbi:MAG TPA: demethoxyubiquinone hydroxylase family protein [Kofleriaceae bacterium]|nr:demethoxyubiquinone hydroxylase family protein [Kofleriaceae bacterium]
MKEPFRADMEMIRRRAREKMDRGAVTEAYRADVGQVIDVLNEVLATEIVCVLRYKNHYFMAPGVHGDAVASEFLQHATEEQQHADQVARRIAQLGGNPDLDPAGLATRAHAVYREGDDLDDMIREDLAAERVAIATYSEIIRWLGDDDPTTRRMMEEILAKEEEHADELAMLLEPTRRRPVQAARKPVPLAGVSGSAASGVSGVNRGRGTS